MLSLRGGANAQRSERPEAPADVIGNAVKLTRIATGEHKALRITSAMAAGLTDGVWVLSDVLAIMDDMAPKPGRPKTYKKRAAA
jgi:hypothetical protein